MSAPQLGHETYVYTLGTRKWFWRCLDVDCGANEGVGPFKRRMDADDESYNHQFPAAFPSAVRS